ncbi:MAG: DNA gyrase subunit A [Alphaproteobacteria bacterium]|nr:DNA gyrase subunit A [Alphaproteobacteria bacterium]MBQ8557650.1 DNA gyrase subunit A [Alphaproteobacteria bacterium]
MSEENIINATPSDVLSTPIEEEMRKSYLDYAMSVIVSRALPDVRDGLKPVHRRILFSMNENGYDYNKPFRKSARIVGDVMGKYHPHGDSSIYEAMVRMAQTFSMRVPLISSQGNFGSMDGDKAAAMRYTEARLAQTAHWLLEDIDQDTVDFRPNYDETCQEPEVLPARFPNILVNGSGGIAVGMATNMPPHNLAEVISGCIAMIDNPDITSEELMAYIPAPDFPTGGIILGRGGARSAYTTGRGSVIMRGRCAIEEIKKDKTAIVVTEIPYQVNKAQMIVRIAELVKEKVIEGISDLRDESDRQGVRVVIELKRDAHPEVVLNQLYKYTPLQTSFGMNMLALNNGRPELMTLQGILSAFIKFREEVVRRRTVYQLNKARDRAHVLVGLAIAVANLDNVIEMIKTSADSNIARTRLMETKWDASDVAGLIELIDEPGRKVVDGCYMLSEAQARAILDLKLQRLTGLERDKVHGEVGELAGLIKGYLSTLASREKIYAIIREELEILKAQYPDGRRTTIEDAEFEQDMEDLIPRETMVVTVSNNGYIKRVPLSTYRAQHRGGKGRAGMSTREEDQVSQLFVACTHSPLLFFSTRGIVYKLKTYRLPEGSPQSLGKALINLLPLQQGETISTILTLPEQEADCENQTVVFATASGNVRRNRLSDFYNVNANGKIAMKLDEGDVLIGVQICNEEHDVLLSAAGGKCVRFPVADLRVFESRASTGVRGMKLADGDTVISMSVVKHAKADIDKRDAYLKESAARRRLAGQAVDGDEIETESLNNTVLTPEEFEKMAQDEEFILTITDKGYGKRSSAYEYRITARGTSGVVNIKTDEGKRKADVVASMPVPDDAHIMLVTDGGKLIRMKVSDIRIAGRSTMGVILFRLDKEEKVVSATCITDIEDDMPVEEETAEAPKTDMILSETIESETVTETTVETVAETESNDI